MPGDKPRWLDRAWQRVREEVDAGHQAYVVCPRIGDDDVADEGDRPASRAGDPTTTRRRARRAAAPLGVLAVRRRCSPSEPAGRAAVEVLHGRLPRDEKDAVMRRFAAGELDVLVATTVVEVGVDVPNATSWWCWTPTGSASPSCTSCAAGSAVARRPGLCLLVTEHRGRQPARDRLNAVAATIDGFELARLDLAQRREGDVLGAAQSGRRSQLRLLRVLRDEEVIEQARDDAPRWWPTTRELAGHPALAAAVARPSAPSGPTTWSAADDPDHRRHGRRPHAAHPAGPGTRPTSDRVREALFSAARARGCRARRRGCSTCTPVRARSGWRRSAAVRPAWCWWSPTVARPTSIAANAPG